MRGAEVEDSGRAERADVTHAIDCPGLCDQRHDHKLKTCQNSGRGAADDVEVLPRGERYRRDGMHDGLCLRRSDPAGEAFRLLQRMPTRVDREPTSNRDPERGRCPGIPLTIAPPVQARGSRQAAISRRNG